MPLWEVERDSMGKPVNTKGLFDGRHEIRFGTFSIPIFVNSSEVTLFVSEAAGDMHNAVIKPLGQSFDGVTLKDMNRETVRDVTFRLPEGQSGLTIVNDGRDMKDTHFLHVEQHKTDPINTSIFE